MCSVMSDRCRTLIMEPESMSRLPFGIVWDSDLWAWLIGDLLRKPMYQLGLGHSTLIPPCELRLRGPESTARHDDSRSPDQDQATNKLRPQFHMCAWAPRLPKSRAADGQIFLCRTNRSLSV